MLSPLDLIRAHGWSGAFFTTYSLSLSFFEAVVLDALVRQGVGSIRILADVEGVRASLAEHGARSAGRTYEVEPVAVDAGCFHPKLTVLTSATEAHLLIGSGNLTFGGWGTNLECVEHLHPGFAADAFNDAADFLSSLPLAERVTLAAPGPCGELANDLRNRAAGGRRTGRVRLLHSLNRPIGEQLAEIADELGGAQRLAVASPFFDGGVALDHLCKRLGLDRVAVHVHGAGTVVGTAGSNWPTHAGTTVEPVAIEPFAQVGPRLLHAKVFEVLCRKGRVVLSGSANATMAALGGNRNVELCVARIDRDAMSGWRLAPAAPPLSIAPPVRDEELDPRKDGVLRAVLRGETLDGRILTAFPAGRARIFRITGSGPVELGVTEITEERRFTLTTRDLERQAWTAQRLILRVEAPGYVAQGFVSFADLAAVTRRAGAMASRLFAILAGTETPEDIAVLMSWFHENPMQFSQGFSSGGSGDAPQETSDAYALVSDLLEPAWRADGGGQQGSSGTAGWRRFMDHLLACFRQPRGPIAVGTSLDAVSAGDDGEGADVPLPLREDPQVEQALSAFERLFELMAGATADVSRLGVAFHLTQYVCDRLEPDAARVRRYLDKLIDAATKGPLAEQDREMAVAAVLVQMVLLPSTAEKPAARIARRKLLRLGADLRGAAPDISLVHTFVRLLAPELDVKELWEAVRAVRTGQEEVKAYWKAIDEPVSELDFPLLAGTPQWKELSNPSPAFRHKRIWLLPRFESTCPCCKLKLPSGEASWLREIGVATASNCCGRVLLCDEV